MFWSGGQEIESFRLQNWSGDRKGRRGPRGSLIQVVISNLTNQTWAFSISWSNQQNFLSPDQFCKTFDLLKFDLLIWHRISNVVFQSITHYLKIYLVAFELGALDERFPALCADVDPGPVRVQVFSHGRVIAKHFSATFVGTCDRSGDLIARLPFRPWKKRFL